MSREPRVYLEDMADRARRVLAFTEGVEFEQFVADEMRYDAVLRSLEILGEAAKQLPASVRHAIPGIPWRDVIRFRDRLAHGYSSVDDEIVWRIITEDIPPLYQRLLQALDSAAGPGLPGD